MVAPLIWTSLKTTGPLAGAPLGNPTGLGMGAEALHGRAWGAPKCHADMRNPTRKLPSEIWGKCHNTSKITTKLPQNPKIAKKAPEGTDLALRARLGIPTDPW